MSAPVDEANRLCERTEMPVDWCGHCRVPDLYAADVKAEKARLARNAKPKGERLLGPWFDALFIGECSRCGTPFEPGEHVRADYPEGTGLIRRGCHERARARREKAA
jgi:hypothetical protein